MDKRYKQHGLDELRSVRRESRIFYWSVGLFSFFREPSDADWAALYVTGLRPCSGLAIRGEIDRIVDPCDLSLRDDGAA